MNKIYQIMNKNLSNNEQNLSNHDQPLLNHSQTIFDHCQNLEGNSNSKFLTITQSNGLKPNGLKSNGFQNHLNRFLPAFTANPLDNPLSFDTDDDDLLSIETIDSTSAELNSSWFQSNPNTTPNIPIYLYNN